MKKKSETPKSNQTKTRKKTVCDKFVPKKTQVCWWKSSPFSRPSSWSLASKCWPTEGATHVFFCATTQQKQTNTWSLSQSASSFFFLRLVSKLVIFLFFGTTYTNKVGVLTKNKDLHLFLLLLDGSLGHFVGALGPFPGGQRFAQRPGQQHRHHAGRAHGEAGRPRRALYQVGEVVPWAKKKMLGWGLEEPFFGLVKFACLFVWFLLMFWTVPFFFPPHFGITFFLENVSP